MQDPNFEPPVNPLPPVVILLFLAMAGVEAGLSLGEAGIIGGPDAIGWRLALARDYGFSGAYFDWMLANGQYPLQQMIRVVTYAFIHLSFSHALLAIVLMLALGKMVGEAMGQTAVVVIFFGSSILGAIIYALLLDDPLLLVGGYPGVYGLIGGYSFVMWHQLAGTGAGQYRAFSLIGILMGLQLIWGVFFDVGLQWVAELSGFCVGFGLSFLVVPGGIARLRAMLLRR